LEELKDQGSKWKKMTKFGSPIDSIDKLIEEKK